MKLEGPPVFLTIIHSRFNKLHAAAQYPQNNPEPPFVCTFKADSVIAAIRENQQKYRPKCVEENGTPSRLLNAIGYFHDHPSSQGKYVEMAAHSGPYELEQAKDGRLMSSSSVWNACLQLWQRDRRQSIITEL